MASHMDSIRFPYAILRPPTAFPRVARHEDRLLQHQRRQGPPARPARLAARRRHRRRRAAGAQVHRRRSSPASRSRRWATTLKPMDKRASTASPSSPACRSPDVRRGLPGDDGDEQSRWIEAEVAGIRVCGLYLPNGNPAPGPKYDYKLAWMDRLQARAADLIANEETAVVLGDYNVIPEPKDCWNPAVWANDALFLPPTRAGLPPPRQPRLHRRAARRRPGPRHLHLLGLPGRRLPEELGHPHRPRPADPAGRGPPRRPAASTPRPAPARSPPTTSRSG